MSIDPLPVGGDPRRLGERHIERFVAEADADGFN
jgi:hypothetical protein